MFGIIARKTLKSHGAMRKYSGTLLRHSDANPRLADDDEGLNALQIRFA
jgi:hypothetical protein